MYHLGAPTIRYRPTRRREWRATAEQNNAQIDLSRNISFVIRKRNNAHSIILHRQIIASHHRGSQRV